MYYPYDDIKRVAKLNGITIIEKNGIDEDECEYCYTLRSESKGGKVQTTHVDSYHNLAMLFMALPVIKRHFNADIKLLK